MTSTNMFIASAIIGAAIGSNEHSPELGWLIFASCWLGCELFLVVVSKLK